MLESMQRDGMEPVNVNENSTLGPVVEEHASVVDVFDYLKFRQMFKIKEHVWLWGGKKQGLAVLIDDQTCAKKVGWIVHSFSKFPPVTPELER